MRLALVVEQVAQLAFEDVAQLGERRGFDDGRKRGVVEIVAGRRRKPCELGESVGCDPLLVHERGELPADWHGVKVAPDVRLDNNKAAPYHSVTHLQDATMTATMTQTRTREVFAMAHCKKCKAAKRISGTSTRRYQRTDKFGNDVFSRTVNFGAMVQCWNGCTSHAIGGTTVEVNQIRGVVTETPCDARCTSAKGHQCECSCGGKNHGSQA